MKGHKTGKSLHTPQQQCQKSSASRVPSPHHNAQRAVRSLQVVTAVETLDLRELTDHQTPEQLPAEEASASTSQSSTSVLKREQGREGLAAVLRPPGQPPQPPFTQPSIQATLQLVVELQRSILFLWCNLQKKKMKK